MHTTYTGTYHIYILHTHSHIPIYTTYTYTYHTCIHMPHIQIHGTHTYIYHVHLYVCPLITLPEYQLHPLPCTHAHLSPQVPLILNYQKLCSFWVTLGPRLFAETLDPTISGGQTTVSYPKAAPFFLANSSPVLCRMGWPSAQGRWPISRRNFQAKGSQPLRPDNSFFIIEIFVIPALLPQREIQGYLQT